MGSKMNNYQTLGCGAHVRNIAPSVRAEVRAERVFNCACVVGAYGKIADLQCAILTIVYKSESDVGRIYILSGQTVNT